jgi:hypothetical protein
VFVAQGESDQLHSFLLVIYDKDFVGHGSAPPVRACCA